MYKYEKIQPPFERNTETKKLIERRYISPEVEYLKDNLWRCTEKIDGTNVGVVWDGYNVSFQGRTEKAQIPPYLQSALNDIFLSDGTEEIFEQIFGWKQAILFGEGYGGKIQNGKAYRENCSFILFDVYMPESDLYLKPESVKDIAELLHIDIVPFVGYMTLEQAVAFVKEKPKSNIGSANMEGLVCRPAADLQDRSKNRITVKVKVKDFAY